ncbi:MFS general substrate transporter [Mollisia scopiformis]|uniref:MFS general substrate transporter n=1 Tax=Mollisia scopiformis TaxID=149040 RepID=A0A194XQY1_MOLSC|nr:MFS general substrate transporter [Mollisia scopiformis]KUJ22464.1 MFS general substrate transporter [Mollisia scopiformis]
MQPRDMPGASHETSPLLQDRENGHDGRKLVELSKEDDSHPRTWGKGKKLANIAVIGSMSILSPLASSMFTPGIKKIADSLDATETGVIACQTGFVIMLGIGPLILAPLSETFGRKVLYLSCFTVFTLLQIPTALAKTLPVLVTLRTIAGFFGSVGIANGGGTISDMYDPGERANIFGWYLLGPLLGPSLGPLLGSVILQNMDWPWLFWIVLIICSVSVIGGFLFLRETYVPVLLSERKKHLERSEGGSYYFEGEDDRSLSEKLVQAVQRPIRILFTQPIVLTMASYQALLFAITYSLYTQFESIYGEGYGFDTLQVGFVYLAPGMGFLVAVWFLVPRIGAVYNSLTKKHNGKSKPEYRLPIANIGAVLIPISLFWFAWTVEYHVHWAVTILPTFFYGIGQVAIFNSVQNYYIDSFEKYAASAIAAGALFRSVIGGIVPLFTGALIEKLGVGWGMSVFGFVSVLLAPSPLLFWYYGEWLRERFAISL